MRILNVEVQVTNYTNVYCVFESNGPHSTSEG